MQQDTFLRLLGDWDHSTDRTIGQLLKYSFEYLTLKLVTVNTTRLLMANCDHILANLYFVFLSSDREYPFSEYFLSPSLRPMEVLSSSQLRLLPLGQNLNYKIQTCVNKPLIYLQVKQVGQSDPNPVPPDQ